MVLASRFFVTESDTQETTVTLIIFFVLVLCASGLSISCLLPQIWTIINELFRPSQAQRIYPILGTAEGLGSLLGGVAISLITAFVGVSNLVIVWGLACICMAILAMILNRQYGAMLTSRIRPGSEESEAHQSLKNLKASLSLCWHSPLLKLMAVATICTMTIDALQDYQYTFVMSDTFASEADLAKFYGLYMVVFHAAMVLFQITLTGRIIRKFGVAGCLFILPATIFATMLVLLFSKTFWPALAMRYFWELFFSTIEYSVYILTFNAVAARARGRALGVYEGILTPIGTMVGGAVILGLNELISTSHFFSGQLITITGLVIAGTWLLVTARIRHNYVDSLITNTGDKERRTVLDAIDSLGDVRNKKSLQTLVHLLASPEEEIRLTALDALGQSNSLYPIRNITDLLKSKDATLRARTIHTIQRLTATKKEPLLDYSLRANIEEILGKDNSPLVRSEALAYIMANQPASALPKFVAKMLNHQDPAIREKTITTLAANNLHYIDYCVEKMLQDPDPNVRAAAITTLSRFPERRSHVIPTLRQMLKSKETEDRLAGLKTLATIQDPQLLEDAVPLMKDEHPKVRIFAALSYLAIGKPDTNALDNTLDTVVQGIENLNDSNYIEQELIPILANLPEEALDELLMKLAMLPSEIQKNLSAMKGFSLFLKTADAGANIRRAAPIVET